MKIRALSATLALVASSVACLGMGAAPAEAAPPSNDLIANATTISGASGSVSGTTAGATWTAEDPAGWDPQHTDPAFSSSVWFEITAPDDISLRFTLPYPSTGTSVGTFVTYDGGAPQLVSDDYSAVGWSAEVSPGGYETVGGFAGVALIDYSHDALPTSARYYVRVKSTAAGAGAFTLSWAPGGLPTTTTATTSVDHDAGTFEIHPSTSCTQSFYDGPPPTPTPPADSGYYIVRDELGAVVGSKRRWNVTNPTSETSALITDLPLLPGSHTYTVRFYYGSSYLYCAGSQTEVTVVDAQPTVTTLSAVVSKQKVTFSGSVTPAPPAGSSIQISEVHDSLLGLLLSSGSATGSLTGVRPGRHTYIGWFESPFPAYASSTAVPVTVTVPKYTTTTSLAAPTSVKVGARPTITARVKVGGVAARGSVVIRLNGRIVATRTLVNGMASQRLPRLARGRATVKVTYRATTLNASSSASRVIAVRR